MTFNACGKKRIESSTNKFSIVSCFCVMELYIFRKYYEILKIFKHLNTRHRFDLWKLLIHPCIIIWRRFNAFELFYGFQILCLI